MTGKFGRLSERILIRFAWGRHVLSANVHLGAETATAEGGFSTFRNWFC